MEPLSWTVHRAKETPGKTVVASAFILAFVGFSWVVFGPVLGMLAVVVLFLALNTYFLPITYALTDKGIEIDKRLFTTRYEWKQFRRWFRTTGGIVISPFSRKNYLDNFRGVHLLLPADERRTPNCEPRTTNYELRTTNKVETATIVAYLEKRFAPPPPDERLRLDDKADDVRS
ncbi:MAG: hypothetical protein NTX53_10415 [candidate division WOR-3 bacterium]|nr:hypothetical protein [candidate division WOR-3 bacterium]